jgi:dTDP-4-dehydrorhamnose reductase
VRDKQKLLITGGSGYLGRALVRLAVESWDVVGTFHASRPTIPDVAFVQLDLRDTAAAERAIAAIGPSCVIHTAYVQDGPDLGPVTVEGSAAVARAARSLGARLIHLSSDVVFDGERDGSYTEHDPLAPVSPYGRAKAEAERLVAELAPEALIVRTSLLYGGDAPSKHEQLALDAASGRADVAFFSDEQRCPIVAGDLAAALLELAQLSVSGPLHVAGADVVSRYEFARLVVQAAGGDTDALRSAVSAGSGLPRPRNCALDSGRAQGLVRTRLRGAYEVLRPTQ